MEHESGCFVCGKDLIYWDKPQKKEEMDAELSVEEGIIRGFSDFNKQCLKNNYKFYKEKS